VVWGCRCKTARWQRRRKRACRTVAATRRPALAMFPDKEFTYDLIYKPRLQRLLAEKYNIQ